MSLYPPWRSGLLYLGGVLLIGIVVTLFCAVEAPVASSGGAVPAAGYASPGIYNIKRKQSCGGGNLKSKFGDQYVAFALNE